MKTITYALSAALLLVGAPAPAQNNNQPDKYNMPYKNTYTKEPLVTENEFRTAKPETFRPKRDRKSVV